MYDVVERLGLLGQLLDYPGERLAETKIFRLGCILLLPSKIFDGGNKHFFSSGRGGVTGVSGNQATVSVTRGADVAVTWTLHER